MRISRRLLAVLGSAVVLVAAGSAVVGASADSGDRHGGGNRHSISDDEISIQLWNFAAYIGFGTDAATQARLEEVLRRLSEIGYRNVEPFTFNGLTAAQFKALLDRYDLKAPSRHGDVSITNFATDAGGLQDAAPEVRRLRRVPDAGDRQLREHAGDRHRDERARPALRAQRHRQVLRPQPPAASSARSTRTR